MHTDRGEIRATLRTWFNVASLLIWGLAIASFFGQWLLLVRTAYSWWQAPLALPIVLLYFWGRFHGKRAQQADAAGCLVLVSFLLCDLVLVCFCRHAWAPLAAGLAAGACVWGLARQQRRSWPIAVAGCLLAGAAAPLIPWPNEQRLLLAFVCVGLAAALQGVWEIVLYLQGRQPEPESTPQPVVSEGQLLRVINLIFGMLEFVQVVSPSVDLRLRTRYQAETAGIASLGLDHLCSYGETFSAFRLLLVVPAIVVLSMWRNREVVRLYEGTKIQACYPLLMARDKTTYAEANGDGVKFYTAFTDGTFLVSGTYVVGGLEKPTMTRHCRVASIRETWTEHRWTIEAFEAGGRRVNRRTDFQTFVDMSRQETAPM